MESIQVGTRLHRVFLALGFTVASIVQPKGSNKQRDPVPYGCKGNLFIGFLQLSRSKLIEGLQNFFDSVVSILLDTPQCCPDCTFGGRRQLFQESPVPEVGALLTASLRIIGVRAPGWLFGICSTFIVHVDGSLEPVESRRDQISPAAGHLRRSTGLALGF